MHSVVSTVPHIRHLVLFHKAAVKMYWICDSIWEEVDFYVHVDAFTAPFCAHCFSSWLMMHWQVCYIFRSVQSMVWQLPIKIPAPNLFVQ